jgi:thermostable 8-oxoguanine DNA glycosylase
LGLTRYEIPIDSGITKWLNDYGLIVKVTEKGLSDENYYNFISDGLQHLCKKVRIYPCVLDAVIFSSFEKDEWPEEKIV